MITVTLRQNGYHVEGHAQHSPHGTDIVCASVSTLVLVTEESLRKRSPLKGDIREGFADVHVVKPSFDTAIILDIFRTGVMQLAEAYPEHVEVNE